MGLFHSGSVNPPVPQPKGETVSLKRYDVEINGVQTTLQLSDEDAEAQGLTGKGKEAPGGDEESEDKDEESKDDAPKDKESKAAGKSTKQAAAPANKGASDK